MLKTNPRSLTLRQTNGRIEVCGRFDFRNHRVLDEAIECIISACEISKRGHDLAVQIHADQMCTWARKKVMHLFRRLELSSVDRGVLTSVMWTVDEGDDDMLELGEIFEELLPDLKFSFQEVELV